MTRAEKNLAARLLRMASDQFSNHGCNDLDLSEVIPDKDERDALVRSYHEWNGDPEEYREFYEGRDYRLMDFMAMNLMANRLEEDDSEGGWCSGCGEAGHTDDDMHVKRVQGRMLVNTWVGHLR